MLETLNGAGNICIKNPISIHYLLTEQGRREKQVSLQEQRKYGKDRWDKGSISDKVRTNGLTEELE